jgi:hypothetical protein
MFGRLTKKLAQKHGYPGAGAIAPTPALKPRRRCAHCGGADPSVSCTTCGRLMCDDCVSHDPEVGPVCGLCYDRKNNPEPD